MRLITALTLCVSLTSAAIAADWSDVHSQALEAVRHREFESAAALFRQSLQLAQNPVQQGISANDLGVTLHHIVRDKEAKPQLETALKIWQTGSAQQARLAETAEALATVNRSLGDYPGAEEVLRLALRTPPADDDTRALVLNELGDILREIGRSQEAHQVFEQSMALPGISVRRKLDATIGLADLDRDSHTWQASFDGWNKGIDIARDHRWVALEAAAVRGLGVTFLDHGEPARAEPLLRRALVLFEGQDVPGHQIASTLSCLAQLYQTEGKYAMAEDALRRAIKIAEKTLGETHPQVAVLYEMLGDSVAAQKELDQSRTDYEHARVIMVGRFGEQSPIVAAVSASWAAVEQRADHKAEAAADYEKALTSLNGTGPEVQTLRQSVVQRYIAVCKALHRKVSPLLVNTPAATAFIAAKP